MEFTKNQTNIAKGIAICLMFIHHLYAFNDRLLNGNSYIPLIPFFRLEDYAGRFGNICVSMFLFLSGYGMVLGYLRSKKTPLRYSLIKLKDFYLTYWLYFLIFVPIGIFFFNHVTLWQSNQIRYTADPIVFLKNFLGWDSSYNQEWWFVRMFVIILVFLFPIYIKLLEKNVAFLVLTSLFLFSLSAKVNPYGEFGFIGWQTSFAVGIICAKFKFFSSRPIQDLDQSGWLLISFSLVLCIALRLLRWPFDASGNAFDFLIVAFFTYFSVMAAERLRLPSLLAYLGERAFPLWLVHSFFCYYYFQDIVYFPRWSPLIFLLLTTMSLLSVLGVEYLRSFCMQRFSRRIQGAN
jgi:hypothetical protein